MEDSANQDVARKALTFVEVADAIKLDKLHFNKI